MLVVMYRAVGGREKCERAASRYDGRQDDDELTQ